MADSVTERISAIAESIRTGSAMPPPRGASTVQLQRGDNGDLVVTKSFENGESEVMTISAKAPEQIIPGGFVDVTPGQQGTPEQQQSFAGLDAGGIVETAALGGNSLDALLRG